MASAMVNVEYWGAKFPAWSPAQLNCGCSANWLMFSRKETWSPETSASNGMRMWSFMSPNESPVVTRAL